MQACKVSTISYMFLLRNFFNIISSISSLLVSAVFHDSPVSTFAGLNLVYGVHYKKCTHVLTNIVQTLFVHF